MIKNILEKEASKSLKIEDYNLLFLKRMIFSSSVYYMFSSKKYDSSLRAYVEKSCK